MDNIRPRKKNKDEGPAWLMTYGDMVTLLLVFFIIFFNIVELEDNNFKISVSQLLSSGNLSDSSNLNKGVVNTGKQSLSFPVLKNKESLDLFKSRFNITLGKDIAREYIKIMDEERGFVISLGSQLFFEKGSAKVNIELARDILQNISILLNDPLISQTPIRIEGHAEKDEINRESMNQNVWKLAAMRSLNILYLLENYGVDEARMEEVSYGARNDTPLGFNTDILNQTFQRRVDIVIITQDLIK